MNSQARSLGFRLALLVLGLIALVPLWPILTGKVIGPFSQIQAMQPWQGTPEGTWDILQADGVLQFWAWRSLMLEGWASLDPAFWNPYQLMGAPLLANSQSAIFYPPHILLGLARVPVGVALNLLAWGHLVWAGLGVFLLCRNLGAGRWGSMFAGASFAVSPFLLTWLPLASVPTTVSWIPWCLAFTTGLLSSADGWKKQAAGLAACFGMMVLAGHLQFVFYGGLAIVLFGLVLFGFRLKNQGLAENGGLRLGLWAAGLALGVCLALPQLLPVLENSKSSHRVATATQEGYAAYVKGALAPYELPGLVFPSLMGYPGQKAEVEGAGDAPVYWPAYVRIGAAPGEGAWGIGPLVLGLAIFAFRRVRKDRKWVADGLSPAAWAAGALAIMAFLLAMGTQLNAALYFGIPGFSATGSPGRVIVLLALALCVLAGLSWPSEDEEEEIPQRTLLIIGAAPVVAGLLFMGLFTRGLSSWMKDFNVDAFVSAQAKAGLLPLALSVLGLAGALILIQRRQWAGALASGVLCQLALGAWLFVPTGVPFLQPGQPNAERFAAVNGQWDLLVRADAVLPPNTGSVLRMRDVAGYDSLLNRDTVEILRGVNAGKDPAPPANGNIMHVKPGASLSALMEAGVTWLVVPGKVEEPPLAIDVAPNEETKSTVLWRKADPESAPKGLIGPEVTVFALAGPGRAFMETPTDRKKVDFAYDGLSRQTLKVQGGGSLVIKDRNLPGWSAFVDGKPAEIEPESPWRVVKVPEGTHQVDFVYTPPGLGSLSLGASLAALICIAALVFLGKNSASTR